MNRVKDIEKVSCSDENIYQLYDKQKLIMIRYEQGQWVARWYPPEIHTHDTMYGQVTAYSGKKLKEDIDFRKVYEYASDYDAAAILLYSISNKIVESYDKAIEFDNVPFAAIEPDGSVKEFTEGYYLVEVDDFVSRTLSDYSCSWTADHDLFHEIDENFNDTEYDNEPLPDEYKYFIKTKGYYRINPSEEIVAKHVINKHYDVFISQGLKEDIKAIQNDKDKENTDYPIIVIGKHKNYVINDDCEVMQIKEGFIKETWNISAAEVIDQFLEDQVEIALNA